MTLVAQVAVDNATFQFDKLYSYLVPASLQALAKVGSMVLVPFGKGDRPRLGVVLQLAEQPAEKNKKLKTLLDCAPEEARLTPDLLQLVYYLKEFTFCTYFDAVRAIIPYGAQYRAAGDKLRRQMAEETETVYRFVTLPADAKLPHKQRRIYDFLQQGEATRQEIETATGAGIAALQGLVKNGGAQVQRRRIIEVETGESQEMPIQSLPPLSSEQQSVLAGVLEDMQRRPGKGALLYGVTGSGKTYVYLHLLQQVLAGGKTAVVMVPEIALTPQLVDLLVATFGARVAVQHSSLSHGERLRQWSRIQQGQADIVVGTRTAVFAPLSNIGLFIMDEEQENTYYSESSPRFSTREAALYRAKKSGATVLLGSATPSVDSFYRAQKGIFSYFELTRRYGEAALPEVEIADMRDELHGGNTGAFSGVLAAELQQNLQEGYQSIVLLNRRGYHTIAMCPACKNVIECDSCSVPMVYHKKGDRLLCHYCGRNMAPPEKCPVCGEALRYTGLGTQRVEEELAEILPTARVLRMDMDSTGRKNAHRNMLTAFGQKKYDVLLGTQMVAKGLDFPLVTLVGVLGIDQMLFAQSYTAYERVFSLVTQVVGRGGRAQSPARAVLQTVDPENPVLALAAKQDYKSFYKEEINLRKLHLYPPFCTLCTVSFQGPEDEKTAKASLGFLAVLKQVFPKDSPSPLRVLGPAPYHILRVQGKFRYKLTLKCRNDKAFRQSLADALGLFGQRKEAGGIQVSVDMNPTQEL